MNKKIIILAILVLIISSIMIVKIKKNTVNIDSSINMNSNGFEIEIKNEIKETAQINNNENKQEKKEETNKDKEKEKKKETKKNVVQKEKKEVTKIEQSVSKKENKKEEVTYIKGILLVNKKYNLPKTYNPGVDPTAKAAFEEMKKEAEEDKITLNIVSSFRSYSAQKSIYSTNLKKHGEKIASRFSAKAGQSEHQTGLAFDLNKANRSFVGTKEAKWLAENCYKYGFIIRYPENKEAITGYVYEPWHVRYVGKEVAKEIYSKKICLEEYLGVK